MPDCFQATINFDVQYFSPDGKVGNFTTKSDFVSPIALFDEYGDTGIGSVHLKSFILLILQIPKNNFIDILIFTRDSI